jgi:uncharacterized protein with GYD domain
MAKFAMFFSYTPNTWAQMMKNPGDRLAASRAAIEPLGGRIEALYFMFGEWDGFSIIEVDDSDTAAAISIGISSTGAFSKVETRQLIAPEDLPAVLNRAAAGVERYSPPGS